MIERNLDIVVRAHTIVQQPNKTQKKKRLPHHNTNWQDSWPKILVVLDTETTTDLSQRLTFGCYRVYTRTGNNLARESSYSLTSEGLFYADDLTPEDIATLTDYAESHREGDLHGELHPLGPLTLLTHREFLYKVFRPLLKKNGLVVGFNLPYDLSRIAQGYTIARKDPTDGGFSFWFWEYTDEHGQPQPSKYTPNIAIRQINPRAAFIQATRPQKKDPRYREADPRCLDLHALAYALTGKTYSLESAGKTFNCRFQKTKVEEETHGKITREYIDYCRQDVLATFSLYLKLMEEVSQHPIPTPPDRLYSTASLGKSYLKAMNITLPALDTSAIPESPDQILGYAMSAYYGGRSETHIRALPVPVVYCDFLSMYPTVCVLMGLWRFITSQSIQVTDATQEVQEFINNVTKEDLFKPETWKLLNSLVQIIPDGSLRLPTRSYYNEHDNQPKIGLNYLSARSPLWYAFPDVVAGKLLSGKSPKILRALRFTPGPPQPDLKPTRIRNHVPVDPAHDDFPKLLIEERKCQKNNPALPDNERNRLDLALKIIANSTSYGIFAELNRDDDPDAPEQTVTVFTYLDKPYSSTTRHPEIPGNFYFPPVAAFITAAARLMLALAQLQTESKGGTYAFMDTDSIAIVADNERCTLTYTDHHRQTQSLNILSLDDVEDIVNSFKTLNPYDQTAIPGSILKIEATRGSLPDSAFYAPQDLGWDRETQKHRFISNDQETAQDGEDDKICVAWDRQAQDYCFIRANDAKKIAQDGTLYALSFASKRYTLVMETPRYAILGKSTELVLGAFQDPGDRPEDHTWIEQFWLRAYAWKRYGSELNWPGKWADTPALVQLKLNKPRLLNLVQPFNKGRKTYQEQIKPFNFMLRAYPLACAYPDNPKPCLVTPFTKKLDRVKERKWLNLNNQEFLYIQTCDDSDETFTGIASVTSLANACDYIIRAKESKYAGQNDPKLGELVIGELKPIIVRADKIRVSGKEVPLRELTDEETIEIWEQWEINYYPRDPWDALKPMLNVIPTDTLSHALGVDATTIRRWRYNTRPDPQNQAKITSFLLEQLRAHNPDISPLNDNELLNWEGLDSLVISFCQKAQSPSDWDKLAPLIHLIPVNLLAQTLGVKPRKIYYWRNGTTPKPEIRTKIIGLITETLHQYHPHLSNLTSSEILARSDLESLIISAFYPAPKAELPTSPESTHEATTPTRLSTSTSERAKNLATTLSTTLSTSTSEQSTDLPTNLATDLATDLPTTLSTTLSTSTSEQSTDLPTDLATDLATSTNGRLTDLATDLPTSTNGLPTNLATNTNTNPHTNLDTSLSTNPNTNPHTNLDKSLSTNLRTGLSTDMHTNLNTGLSTNLAANLPTCPPAHQPDTGTQNVNRVTKPAAHQS